jgi:hypothetical protein
MDKSGAVSEFNVEYGRGADNSHTFVAYRQECGRARLRRFKLFKFAILREPLAVSLSVTGTYFLLYYVRTHMARHARVSSSETKSGTFGWPLKR